MLIMRPSCTLTRDYGKKQTFPLMIGLTMRDLTKRETYMKRMSSPKHLTIMTLIKAIQSSQKAGVALSLHNNEGAHIVKGFSKIDPTSSPLETEGFGVWEWLFLTSENFDTGMLLFEILLQNLVHFYQGKSIWFYFATPTTLCMLVITL